MRKTEIIKCEICEKNIYMKARAIPGREEKKEKQLIARIVIVKVHRNSLVDLFTHTK